MATINKEALLKDEEVRREIERYKWIESEKAGCDIGFDKAAVDWFGLYAAEWVKFHSSSPKKKVRSAKSYIF